MWRPKKRENSRTTQRSALHNAGGRATIQLKTAQQIDGIRESCRHLSLLLQRLEAMVTPGVALLDIDAVVRDFCRQIGGRPAFLGYAGFPGALCISMNDEVIHGIPDRRRIAPGDVVSVDCGIDLDGFISDGAFTVAVPPVTDAVDRLLRVTKSSLALGIEQAVRGNRLNDIARAVFAEVNRHGYGVVRDYCGHGVGLDIHEPPEVRNFVAPGPNPRLQTGMVLAIEPMVTMGKDAVYVRDDRWTVATVDGSIAAHFEHTIAVFDDHTEVLTLPGYSAVEASS